MGKRRDFLRLQGQGGGLIGVLRFERQKPLQDYRKADFSAMLAVWGNGNALLGYVVFYALTMRLVHARTKHPRFAEGRFEALGVIGAEYRELEKAIERESAQRQEDEARDVIATCLRFLNGEHEQSTGQTK